MQKKTLKRVFFCIFRGDATICGRRDPDFCNHRRKKYIRKVVWSGYPFRDPKPRFEWTNISICLRHGQISTCKNVKT